MFNYWSSLWYAMAQQPPAPAHGVAYQPPDSPAAPHDSQHAPAPVPAPSSAAPPSRVRHLKRGSTYAVIGKGRVQTDVPLRDNDPVVIYQADSDGSFWVRSPTEFFDGRFQKVEE